MNKLQLGIAMAVGALTFSSARADIVLQDCNGCSRAQVETKAPLCGNGYAYVSDFVSQNLYKLCYTWENVDRSGGDRIKDYRWASPEQNALETFQAYQNIYLNNGHKEAADVSIRVDIAPVLNLHGDDGHMNAYDTVASTQNNDAVAHYLDSTFFTQANVDGMDVPASPALSAALASLLNHFQASTPLITTNPNFPVVVVIVFADGSKRTYSFNYTTQAYTAVAGTARDGHGNLIPENTGMVSNGGGTETYGFGGNGPGYDQGNLNSLLQGFGARIISGGGSFVTCTWDGTHNTITCTYHT